jgi:hypothetical protein
MRVLIELRRGLFVELEESELTVPAAQLVKVKAAVNSEIVRRYTE